MRIVRAAQRSEAEIAREVAACVLSGGRVIFPTETVYGIGCDPDNDLAIDRLYVAKGRAAAKPLALHVANGEQALPYVGELGDAARVAMDVLWPGPVAIIVRRNEKRFAHAACGLATISLRCPSHDLCRALLEAAGPLAATSANFSGAPPFWGDDGGVSMLPEADMVVLAGATLLRRESTIIDCSGEQPTILRHGAMPVETIVEKLGTLGPVR
jgi:L-threonylcarbamoyladenylate synthase